MHESFHLRDQNGRCSPAEDAIVEIAEMENIRKGVEVVPETIPENLYVLTSKALYAIPRPAAAEAIFTILDEISVERKESIRIALGIYSETRLDYVDCLLIAEGLSPSTEIISFDRKLLNEMKRRMHVSVQE